MDRLYPVPPPELVEQWANEAVPRVPNPRRDEWERGLVARAAAWGADQELEACVEWVQGYAECGDSLRAARHSTPPSLAQEALRLAGIELNPAGKNGATIIEALHRLAELEQASPSEGGFGHD